MKISSKISSKYINKNNTLDYSNSYFFNFFLFIILFFKLLFFYSVIFLKKAQKLNNKKKIKFFNNLKILSHSLFFILMSLLIIFLFIPHSLNPKPIIINGKTKSFLFLFGILTLSSISYPEFINSVKFFVNF